MCNVAGFDSKALQLTCSPDVLLHPGTHPRSAARRPAPCVLPVRRGWAPLERPPVPCPAIYG